MVLTLILKDGRKIILQDDDCVAECLRRKARMGKEITDQDIAICFSECEENMEELLSLISKMMVGKING